MRTTPSQRRCLRLGPLVSVECALNPEVTCSHLSAVARPLSSGRCSWTRCPLTRNRLGVTPPPPPCVHFFSLLCTQPMRGTPNGGDPIKVFDPYPSSQDENPRPPCPNLSVPNRETLRMRQTGRLGRRRSALATFAAIQNGQKVRAHTTHRPTPGCTSQG